MTPIPRWRRLIYGFLGIVLAVVLLDLGIRVWISWRAGYFVYDMKYQGTTQSGTAYGELKNLGIRAVPYLVDAFQDRVVQDTPGRVDRIADLLAEITGQSFGSDVPRWRAWMATREIDFQLHRSPLGEWCQEEWKRMTSPAQPPPEAD